MPRKYVIEICCLGIALQLYYAGIQQLLSRDLYAGWLSRSPLLTHYVPLLLFLVPIGQLVVAFLVVVRRTRIVGLYLFITGSLLFIGWILYVYVFTGYLFWPYAAWWGEATWLQKISYQLVLAWVALVCSGISTTSYSLKKLRNTPATTGTSRKG